MQTGPISHLKGGEATAQISGIEGAWARSQYMTGCRSPKFMKGKMYQKLQRCGTGAAARIANIAVQQSWAQPQVHTCERHVVHGAPAAKHNLLGLRQISAIPQRMQHKSCMGNTSPTLQHPLSSMQKEEDRTKLTADPDAPQGGCRQKPDRTMTVTNLTGLAPLPEAKGLPVGLRVLVDDVQQLGRLGQVAVYLGLQAAGNPFMMRWQVIVLFVDCHMQMLWQIDTWLTTSHCCCMIRADS